MILKNLFSYFLWILIMAIASFAAFCLGAALLQKLGYLRPISVFALIHILVLKHLFPILMGLIAAHGNRHLVAIDNDNP